MDGLTEAIAHASTKNAGETDAGWVSVFESGAISVIGYAERSGIPVTSTGREKTKQDFAEQSSEHRVIGFRR